MFGFGKPVCPIEEESAEWLESRFTWLVERFGKQDLLERRVIEPTDAFFPYPLGDDDDNAIRTYALICDYMGIGQTEVSLELYDGDAELGREMASKFIEWRSNAPAGTWDDESLPRICISRDTLENPAQFIATVAHELCHQHLLGRGHLTGEEEDHEPLTDLCTVFMGMGIFGANACIHFEQYDGGGVSGYRWSSSGYLDIHEWAYGLALFALTRQESKPAWRSHLRPDVKSGFDKATRWLMRR